MKTLQKYTPIVYFDIWAPKLQINHMGKVKEVLYDQELHEEISKYKWYVIRGGYAHARMEDGKWCYMHRFIMQAPFGLQVDHINGNRLDNRKENLRVCTLRENRQARHKTAKPHGYKGVTKVNRRFRASIKSGGKRRHLGYYDTPKQAAEAYDVAAIKIFREFAVLNNVEGL